LELFTEDDLLGAVSGAAGSYEHGRDEEEGQEGGCALSWYRGWLCVGTTIVPDFSRRTRFHSENHFV